MKRALAAVALAAGVVFATSTVGLLNMASKVADPAAASAVTVGAAITGVAATILLGVAVAILAEGE